jgi:hypothetical protein
MQVAPLQLRELLGAVAVRVLYEVAYGDYVGLDRLGAGIYGVGLVLAQRCEAGG